MAKSKPAGKPKMPMHKMPDGHMMPDAEHKAMMGQPKKKRGK